MSNVHYSAVIEGHIAAAKSRRSLVGYAMSISSLFDYVDRFKDVPHWMTSERLMRLLEFRRALNTPPLRYQYVLLYRIADIARLVGKKPYRVFVELVYQMTVPAIATSRTKKTRAWFVPYCHDLVRYLARHGYELSPDRYVLVEVPHEDECKALQVCAMAHRLVKDEKVLAALRAVLNRIRRQPDLFNDEKLPVAEITTEIARDITELERLRLDGNNQEFPFLRMGKRIFIWRPLYLLAQVVDIQLNGKRELKKETALQKGFKYLVRRFQKVPYSVREDVPEYLFFRKVGAVIDGCRTGHSLNLRFRFYEAMDDKIGLATNAAQIDREFARLHFLYAMIKMREANAKMKPVARSIWANVGKNVPSLEDDAGYRALNEKFDIELDKFQQALLSMWKSVNGGYPNWSEPSIWDRKVRVPVPTGRKYAITLFAMIPDDIGRATLMRFGSVGYYYMLTGEPPPSMPDSLKQVLVSSFPI